jgi:hypothetical protein
MRFSLAPPARAGVHRSRSALAKISFDYAQDEKFQLLQYISSTLFQKGETQNMDSPKRYHPLMVVLHWLTVILILGAGLLSGGGGSSPISPHMVLGSLLLVTMISRLIVRFTVKRPA